jgi:predicted DNA-binding protein with PD1-like motif
MKCSEAALGRVFVVRLEDGEILHETIENFARERGIRSAALLVLGGVDAGSRLVVGPSQARATPVAAMETELAEVHEATGVGTIFPDANGNAVLHMHIGCGRAGAAAVGCVRKGVKTWHVLEVVIWELVGTDARRVLDSATGFELLQP